MESLIVDLVSAPSWVAGLPWRDSDVQCVGVLPLVCYVVRALHCNSCCVNNMVSCRNPYRIV